MIFRHCICLNMQRLRAKPLSKFLTGKPTETSSERLTAHKAPVLLSVRKQKGENNHFNKGKSTQCFHVANISEH